VLDRKSEGEKKKKPYFWRKEGERSAKGIFRGNTRFFRHRGGRGGEKRKIRAHAIEIGGTRRLLYMSEGTPPPTAKRKRNEKEKNGDCGNANCWGVGRGKRKKNGDDRNVKRACRVLNQGLCSGRGGNGPRNKALFLNPPSAGGGGECLFYGGERGGNVNQSNTL